MNPNVHNVAPSMGNIARNFRDGRSYSPRGHTRVVSTRGAMDKQRVSGSSVYKTTRVVGTEHLSWKLEQLVGALKVLGIVRPSAVANPCWNLFLQPGVGDEGARATPLIW